MEIPSYPQTRLLELDDKVRLQEIFSGLQPEVSELCFANLYLFRKAHGYMLSQVGNSLVVFGHGYDGEPYFLPPLSGDRGETARRLLADGKTLYGADEHFVTAYLDRADLDISEDRNNFDYLYLREELAQLPGNRFHKKKNRINYFTARHTYAVEQFSPEDHRAGALTLLAEWKRVHAPLTGSSLDLETEATREAVEQAELLELDGVVVLLEGEVAAFSLGERLNSSTAVCHFEKSAPFIEGISQLVNREFSSRLFPDCIYINREQDLGDPGLREAKKSYRPVSLVKKYRISSAGR